MARRKRMKQTRRAEDDDEKAPLPLPEAEVEDFRSKIQDRSERWAEEYSEELQRTFVLMKELDDRSEHMKGNIHETWQQYCTARSQDASDDAVAASSRTSQLREIRDHTQKAVSLSEEKLALALSAYEVVDRQIRRLDMDLLKTEKSLCAALRQEMTDALQPSSSNRVHVPVPKETDRFSPEGQLLTFWSGLISLDPLTCLAYLREFLQSDTPAPDAGKKKRKTSEKRSETPSNLGPTGLIDYDPSEPTYCYCDNVSYGEVCTMTTHSRWWHAKMTIVRASGWVQECLQKFHYACVGLEQPPKGKWFCQFCAPPGWKGPGTQVPEHAPIRPDRSRAR